YIKFQGVDAFERLLSGSERAADYRMSQIAGKYDLTTDEGRLQYSQEVSAFIITLDNSVERDIYTHRAADAAGVAPEAMRELVQRAAKNAYSSQRKRELRRELNPATQLVQPAERDFRYDNVRSARAEEGLIRLLLMDDSLFPEPLPLAPGDFSSPVLRKAFFTLWDARRNGYPVSFHQLSEALTQQEMSHITAVYQGPESSENASRALSDYIRVIREEADKRSGRTDGDILESAQRKYKKQKPKGGIKL
ncbi:MAG: DNA primase, partial [Oscillibacter sp.]|nr:DNA primase [Oscillibacter sp.]